MARKNEGVRRVIDALKAAGCEHEGGNAWTCPSHSDERASFAVDPRKDGRGAVVTCSAGCTFEEILGALSLTKEDLISGTGAVTTTYTYEDENGEEILEVYRTDYPSGRKEFRQCIPGKTFADGVKGVRRILYGLTEVREAISNGTPIYIVEGEKSVLALAERGRVATTAAMGTDGWHPEHTELIRGAAEVIIVADNDPGGYKHALSVARALKGAVGKIRVVRSATDGYKDDIVEHLAAGFKGKDLINLPPEKLRELAELEAEEENTVKIGGNKFVGEEGSVDILPGARWSNDLWFHPSVPMANARKFVKDYRTHADGSKLVCWRGDFYDWNGHNFTKADELTIKADLYDILEKARYPEEPTEKNPDVTSSPWNPTKAKLANLLDALQACVFLNEGIDSGKWRDGQDRGLVIPFSNGNLFFDDRRLEAATPNFFNLSSLPYPYEPNAGKPARWLKFLDQLWPNDPQSIALLQEWFGYVISGDTSLQKLLFLLGPSRSGKSTIVKVLEALVGANNTVAASLTGMGVRFGLLPFIGKTLAIPGDVRVSRGDQQQIVQYLLNISGEDSQTIERKGVDNPWLGRLGVRFMVVSNEMPRLDDASGALVARTLLLRTTKGFLGREDPGLKDKLLEELPGILLWALEGLERLRNREHFTEVESVKQDLIDMRELTSPIHGFVSEYCEIGDTFTVPATDLYRAYCNWCSEQGKTFTPDAAWFGRDLKTAFPAIVKTRYRGQGTRVMAYSGVKLVGLEGNHVKITKRS